MENARLLDELRARTDEIAGWNRELEARTRGLGLNPYLWTLYGEPYPGA